MHLRQNLFYGSISRSRGTLARRDASLRRKDIVERDRAVVLLQAKTRGAHARSLAVQQQEAATKLQERLIATNVAGQDMLTTDEWSERVQQVFKERELFKSLMSPQELKAELDRCMATTGANSYVLATP